MVVMADTGSPIGTFPSQNPVHANFCYSTHKGKLHYYFRADISDVTVCKYDGGGRLSGVSA